MNSDGQRFIDLHFAKIHEKLDNLHVRHLGTTTSLIAEQNQSGHEAGQSKKVIIDEQHAQAVEIVNIKLELEKLRQTLTEVKTVDEKRIEDSLDTIKAVQYQSQQQLGDVEADLVEMHSKVYGIKIDAAVADAETTEKRYKKIHNIINETFGTRVHFSKLNPDFVIVMEKLERDELSDDYDIFKRNQTLIHDLQKEIQHHSVLKAGFERVKDLFLPYGDYFGPDTFDGAFFDMEYVDPTNKKYFKYVSFVAFLLKCQKAIRGPENRFVEFWKDW